MDSPRHRSRLHLACALALAALSLGEALGADYSTETFLPESTSEDPKRWFARQIRLSSIVGTKQVHVVWPGGSSLTNATTGGNLMWNPASGSTPKDPILWTGNVENASPPVTGQNNGLEVPVTVHQGYQGPVIWSGSVSLPSTEVDIVWVGNSYGTGVMTMTPPFEIVVAADWSVSIEDGLEVQKDYEKGIIVFDNLTGQTQDIAFGDETLQLDPGYNAFPFNGEVDENGFPKAADGEWDMMKTTGPDGQTYWFARQAQTGEWGSDGAYLTILPPPSGTSGPVLQISNGNNPGNTDYVALPSGMTAGANVPLPGGMTAGSPGLPPGVTGGSSGALPNGVISGGTNYLPPGVSAGTTSGNNPTPGGTGGTTTGGGQSTGTGTGGSVGGGTTQTQAATEPYLSGASMSGFVQDGKEMGRVMGERITEKGVGAAEEITEAAGGFFGEGGFKFWSGDEAGAISGSDGSWANFQLPIAEQMVTIEIPPQWLTIIRSILLWGVKLWFVVACIKIVMR